jgi:glycosyltransferase involved in cell wall biosynthesis
MRSPSLSELPPPPPNKTGWPWTKESKQLPDLMPDGSPWPRVSIVTPSHNQDQFIEETIRSVLLQGYPDLEYLVVDGGSSDGSVNIIRKYEPWLAHWVSEPDRGQANAINKGFRACSGQIMNWLNSDDCFTQGAVQHIVAYLEANSAAKVVCGFRRIIRENGRYHGNGVHLRPDRFSLSRRCYIAQETTFWRRSVWETVGELDETYQYALDYDFWQRMLAAQYQFHLLPRFIGLFRKHPESKGTRCSETRTTEFARIYSRYLHTNKGEEELLCEISLTWLKRMRMISILCRAGFLNHFLIARAIVSMLSLPESKIPRNPNPSAIHQCQLGAPLGTSSESSGRQTLQKRHPGEDR